MTRKILPLRIPRTKGLPSTLARRYGSGIADRHRLRLRTVDVAGGVPFKDERV